MNITTNIFIKLFNVFLLLTLLTVSVSTHSKTQSIHQRNIKTFSKIQAAFDNDNFDKVNELISSLEKRDNLNNIEMAYIQNFKGSIEFKNNNFEQAAKEFEKIPQNAEGVPEVFVKMIKRVLFDLNKTITLNANSRAKIIELEEKLNNNPSKSERAKVYADLGLNYHRVDKHQQAVDFYSRAINADEGKSNKLLSSTDLFLYSDSLYKNGDKLKALNTYEELYVDEPSLFNEKKSKRLGQLYFDNERFLKAAEYYINAIEKKHIFDDWEAASFILKSFVHAKQKDKALAYAEQSEKQFTDHQFLITLSETYFAFNQWNKTESINLKITKTFKNKSHHPLSWYRIGVARYHFENYRGAKKALKKSLRKVSDKDGWQSEANQLLEKINDKN